MGSIVRALVIFTVLVSVNGHQGCDNRLGGQCIMPAYQPYMGLTTVEEILQKARSIPLRTHCKSAWQAFSCARSEFQGEACSELHVAEKEEMNSVIFPIIEDQLQYICKTEYKNFNRYYRCILSDEVYADIKEIIKNPSAMCRDAFVMENKDECARLDALIDCVTQPIANHCGSKARQLVMGPVKKASPLVLGSYLADCLEKRGTRMSGFKDILEHFDFLKRMLIR